MKFSRRGFLKGLVATAGAALLPKKPEPIQPTIEDFVTVPLWEPPIIDNMGISSKDIHARLVEMTNVVHGVNGQLDIDFGNGWERVDTGGDIFSLIPHDEFVDRYDILLIRRPLENGALITHMVRGYTDEPLPPQATIDVWNGALWIPVPACLVQDPGLNLVPILNHYEVKEFAKLIT